MIKGKKKAVKHDTSNKRNVRACVRVRALGLALYLAVWLVMLSQVRLGSGCRSSQGLKSVTCITKQQQKYKKTKNKKLSGAYTTVILLLISN